MAFIGRAEAKKPSRIDIPPAYTGPPIEMVKIIPKKEKKLEIHLIASNLFLNF